MPPRILLRRLAAALRFNRERREHRRDIRGLRNAAGAARDARPADPLLIGYFEIGLGLGQNARGLATALAAAGAPFSIYPVRAYVTRGEERITDWRQRYDVEAEHDVNVFCVAPDQVATVKRLIGRRRWAASYNVLVAFWEFPEAPPAWRHALSGFDELWVPNAFVAGAFAPIFDGPITVLRPCVTLGAPAAPDRPRFGLDAQAFTFLFTFDYESFAERKNPLAVLDAFRRAFEPTAGDVRLVIKSNGFAQNAPRLAAEIGAAAEADRRIHVIHGELGRPEILSLIASADCYVSLHRAEGFGLGMAEAMLLGKPVIATDYSGNTDFLGARTGFPVPYRLVPVPDGAYPGAQGLSWAEPDVEAAAEAMRLVHADRELAGGIAAAGREEIATRFSPEVTGAAFTTRLAEIARRRPAGR